MSLSSGIDLLRRSSSELIAKILLPILTTKLAREESAPHVLNRTERGSAGSTALTVMIGGVDPALPRSVLCMLSTLCYPKIINEPFSPHTTPFTRHTPADLLPRPGDALLLATQ